MSGLPLIMDDSKTARNDKSVAETLYLIANGKGRAKGAKEGGMKAAPTVKTILISSGEKPITQFSKDGGIRTRVLVVEGSPFGTVDDGSRQIVQAITNSCADQYGVAGPAFMTWVMAHMASDSKTWTQAYRAAKEHYTSQAKTAAEGRLVAHRAFLERVAGVVGQALPDMANGIHSLLQSADWDDVWAEMTAQAGDPLDAQLAMEQLGSWMQAHIELFEGQRNPDAFAPREWLGKWKDDQIAVFHHVVDRQLQEWGYDPHAVVAQWRARGWLTSGEGRHANPKTTIGGQRGRNAYVLLEAGKAVAFQSSGGEVPGVTPASSPDHGPTVSRRIVTPCVRVDCIRPVWGRGVCCTGVRLAYTLTGRQDTARKRVRLGWNFALLDTSCAGS